MRPSAVCLCWYFGAGLLALQLVYYVVRAVRGGEP